ncbi:hypothetical protein DITRI_Ditri14bG0049800 [Diplodiscus trichospermus]
MDIVEKLMSFLVSVIVFLRMRPTLGLPRSQPQPHPASPSSANYNDPEIPHPESPPSDTNDNLESSPSRPQSTQPSAPAPSTNDLEIRQAQSTPRSPNLTAPFNLEQLESILAAQQLKNSVLSFCFSYAVAVFLHYPQTHHQANHPNSSFVLLSFLVLLTFILILVASFISPNYTKTSEVLEKAAFLAAAAAFCHATAIPFPFELKCAVLAVFLLSLLLITIFEYLNRNIA